MRQIAFDQHHLTTALANHVVILNTVLNVITFRKTGPWKQLLIIMFIVLNSKDHRKV